LDRLDEASAEYKMINKYTQAGKSTYSDMRIICCYKLSRKGEANSYIPKIWGNRKLLWHGTRLTNFDGILTHGLKIAPPDAPKTGELFGKGVYFADIIAKSYPYAHANLYDDIGTLILAEVALGNTRELNKPNDDAANLPPGKNSTHALGKLRPDPAGDIKIMNDVTVPLGRLQ
jgi:hypothetical protein